MNWGAVLAGDEYARANLTKTDPFTVERMDCNRGKLIVDGNAAAALGCVFAGCTVLTWYPITPSSSLAEALIGIPAAIAYRPGDRQSDIRRSASRG